MRVLDGEIIEIPKKDIDIVLTVKVNECVVKCPISLINSIPPSGDYQYHGTTTIDNKEYSLTITFSKSYMSEEATVKFDGL